MKNIILSPNIKKAQDIDFLVLSNNGKKISIEISVLAAKLIELALQNQLKEELGYSLIGKIWRDANWTLGFLLLKKTENQFELESNFVISEGEMVKVYPFIPSIIMSIKKHAPIYIDKDLFEELAEKI
jgi:bifunctional DNase/RNase